MNISAANERSKCFAGRAEQIAVFVLLFASFSLEFNAAFHGGSQGQDFYYHRRLTSEAAKNPLHFFYAPSGYADPPGYYILGSAIYNTFGEKNWIVAMSLLGALLNTAALFVLYLISRLFIRSPILRICVLCSAGFLPAFLITSVVIAGDSLCQLPFLLMIYFTALVLMRRIGFKTGLLAAVLSAALCTICKFTALALIPAFICILLLASFGRAIIWLEAVTAGATFLAICLPLQMFFAFAISAEVHDAFITGSSKGSTRLKVRNVFFLRPDDLQLLEVPSHWEMALNPKTCPPSLQNPNRYSYPALLCLATFTDILDFFQSKAGMNREPKEDYKGGALVGNRSSLNNSLMKVSVRAGTLSFCLAACLLPILCIDSLRRFLRDRSLPHLIWLVVFLPAAAWISFIACLLPLVDGAYYGGYYLSRLVLPSILAGVLLIFGGIDRWAFFRKWLPSSVLLCMVLSLSLVHCAFLWMSG